MFNSIRDLVIKCDHAVWYYVNTQWHNAFLDFVIPPFRNPYFWVPLYVFLLVFVPFKFRYKGWLWCVAYLVAFAIADQLTVEMVKPFFHRMRPCRNPLLKNMVHLVVECGSGFSFPSAHAANHFAMSGFIAVTLGKQARWVLPAAIIWAFLVAYAQVYVGVHFPLDVTVGALLGGTIGALTGKIFNRYFKLEKAFPART